MRFGKTFPDLSEPDTVRASSALLLIAINESSRALVERQINSRAQWILESVARAPIIVANILTVYDNTNRGRRAMKLR